MDSILPVFGGSKDGNVYIATTLLSLQIEFSGIPASSMATALFSIIGKVIYLLFSQSLRQTSWSGA